MKNKSLFLIGVFLVSLGLLVIGSLLTLPEHIFDKIYAPALVIGGIGSLIAVVVMTIGAPGDESMKCPACGREVDALIGRQNDPETKVCADCYISEDLKKEKEEK